MAILTVRERRTNGRSRGLRAHTGFGRNRLAGLTGANPCFQSELRAPYSGMRAKHLPDWIDESLAPTEEDLAAIAAVFGMLNRRWALHVLMALRVRPRRFNELGRLYGIGPNTLRTRLTELAEAGLVDRQVVSYVPSHVEYRLTASGDELADVFRGLGSWAARWKTAVASERSFPTAVVQAPEESERPSSGKESGTS